MKPETLEDALAAGLRLVDPYARSSDKFGDLSRRLAGVWGLYAEEVRVKALGSSKNYGNRISEATASNAKLLVLLARDKVSMASLERAIRVRSISPLPALLVVRERDRWRPRHAFIPTLSDADLFPGTPVTITAPIRTEAFSEEGLEEARRRLGSIDGAMASGDLVGQLRSMVPEGGAVSIKWVSSLKQLGNRIGEALGSRPSILLLLLPERLASSAAKFVCSRRTLLSSTEVLLSYESGGRIVLRALDANYGLHERMHRDSPPANRYDVECHDSRDSLTMTLQETDAPIYRRLARVDQLRKLLPLDSRGDHLYEEHLDADERLTYETKTLGFLRALLASKDRVFVVLTGNAGHGKTHMCRRLLEADGLNDQVMEGLEADVLGQRDWEVSGSALRVRFVKDLSELNPPEDAAARLEELLDQSEAHVVVCANEGRLRDVAGRRPDRLGVLIRALEVGLENGDTCPADDPSVHIVNLNFQAAASDGGGFLDHVLGHFLNHQGSWNVCSKCAAQDDCPILANRNDLALSPSARGMQAERRAAFTDLVRIAEESGYVLTYRETLVLVSYCVTGSLTCEDVERLHRDSSRRKKLADHRLLELLFAPRLSEDEFEILGVLKAIGRLDPGRVALRPVDERLHRDLEEAGELGNGLFGFESRNSHPKADLEREETLHRDRLRKSRRAAWLESTDGIDGVTRSERLGLRHHDAFRRLHDGADVKVVLDIIRTLVRGLHTIQGAMGAKSVSTLHLVDPAFARSGSHSAVSARSLRTSELDLWTESKWWSQLDRSTPPAILESVEWLDRRVLLVHRPSSTVLLALELASFEFVMNSARGVVMREFYSAERRRILRALAKHAERDESVEGVVHVLLDGGEAALTIERDQTIILDGA